MLGENPNMIYIDGYRVFYSHSNKLSRPNMGFSQVFDIGGNTYPMGYQSPKNTSQNFKHNKEILPRSGKLLPKLRWISRNTIHILYLGFS